MPKLNLATANRIKVAAGEVSRLKGAGFAWERPAAPSQPLIVFANNTANSALSNGGRTLTRTGSGYANCTASAPLTQKCYFEWELSTLETSAIGLYAGTDPLPENTVLGQWWGQPGLNANAGAWRAEIYAFYGMPAELFAWLQDLSAIAPATAPLWMHGAFDPATRALWLRVRAGGVTFPWSGGGDPAAGTSPTLIFPGAAPVYLGATADGGSVTLLLPDEFTGEAPAGFAVGAFEG